MTEQDKQKLANLEAAYIIALDKYLEALKTSKDSFSDEVDKLAMREYMAAKELKSFKTYLELKDLKDQSDANLNFFK